MKINDPGHDYTLDSIDGGESQRYVFVKREGDGYPGNVGHHPGIQMQEVLRMLIDRAKYVNRQIMSGHTESGIFAMRCAILHFERRHAEKHGRELQSDVHNIENVPTCGKCGHIECEEHKDG